MRITGGCAEYRVYRLLLVKKKMTNVVAPWPVSAAFPFQTLSGRPTHTALTWSQQLPGSPVAVQYCNSSPPVARGTNRSGRAKPPALSRAIPHTEPEYTLRSLRPRRQADHNTQGLPTEQPRKELFTFSHTPASRRPGSNTAAAAHVARQSCTTTTTNTTYLDTAPEPTGPGSLNVH